jgi:PAS domain S-box-containing protein
MNKELHILILEDVPADAELIERELRKKGIVFSSRRMETKEGFLNELKDFLPDLILSDYSLPQFDGLSALAIAKEQCPDVPFILVSGAIGEDLAIETLKKGATDYVLKSRLSRLVPSIMRALREVEERRERKRAEEVLANALNEQKNIMDTIPDIIYLLDLEGKMVKWNRIGEIVTGFSAEEIKGKNVLDFFPDKDKPVVIKAIQEAFEKGYRDIEAGLLLKDGTVLPYHWTGVPLKDEQGKVIGLIGIGRDITERKRAEEELKKRVKELEDFYNMAVTRELKMIELKKQIESLKEELLKYKKE